MTQSSTHSTSNCMVMTVNHVKLEVFIGVTPEEQSKKQDIVVDLTIYFKNPPEACHSDAVSDTLCYATIVQKIQDFCGKNVFRLIEKLAYALHTHLMEDIPFDVNLWLRVDKCNPPIENFKGSTSVAYGVYPPHFA